MADIAESVRLYLVAKTAITNLIGTRIYPDIVEQNATLPAVSISKISTRHEHTLSDFAGVAHCRLQFDCYSNTRTQANEVAETIRTSGIIKQKGLTHGTDIRGARMEDGARYEIDYSNEASDDHRYVTSFDLVIDYLEST